VPQSPQLSRGAPDNTPQPPHAFFGLPLHSDTLPSLATPPESSAKCRDSLPRIALQVEVTTSSGRHATA
jgi:hypothetical protein